MHQDSTWECDECGEHNEPDMDSCSNCGLMPESQDSAPKANDGNIIPAFKHLYSLNFDVVSCKPAYKISGGVLRKELLEQLAALTDKKLVERLICGMTLEYDDEDGYV